MMWILNNIGTIAVFIILAAIVGLIVFRMRKDKAKGKLSCGCNCAECALHGKCGGDK